MTMISGIISTSHVPARPAVNRAAPERSATEEANESPAEKSREQQSPARTASPPVSSKGNVGQIINFMA